MPRYRLVRSVSPKQVDARLALLMITGKGISKLANHGLLILFLRVAFYCSSKLRSLALKEGVFSLRTPFIT